MIGYRFKFEVLGKLLPPRWSDCVGQKSMVERRSEITVKKQMRLELVFPRNALRVISL